MKSFCRSNDITRMQRLKCNIIFILYPESVVYSRKYKPFRLRFLRKTALLPQCYPLCYHAFKSGAICPVT